MRALDYTHRVATLGMQRPRAELTALAAKAEARALAAHRQVAAAMAGGEEALTALLLDPSNPPRQGFHWTRAAAMYREAAAMAA